MKTINNHVPASAMVAQRLAAVREAYPEVDVLDRATDSVKFTFRDGSATTSATTSSGTSPRSSRPRRHSRCRSPGGARTRAGLEALFAAFASTLEEAE